MKKGATHVDWVIGLILFLSLFTVVFYQAYYISTPKQPFEQSLKSQAFLIGDALKNNATWTVYKVPIIIESNNATSDYPVEVYFKLPTTADNNSVLVLNSTNQEINNQFENDTIIFVHNLSNTKNKFYLIYTKDTSLEKRTYTTDLERSGSIIRNLLVNATFGSSGISSLEYKGTEFLYGTGIDLKTSSSPEFINGSARAKMNYTTLNVTIYKNNSGIRVKSSQAFDPDIYLDTYFTSFYNGSSYSFSDIGTVSNGTTDFIDLYSTNGIAIIGNNIAVKLQNQGTYRQITLTDVTEFEIYAHDGDYTNAEVERDMYTSPATSLVTVPLEITGVSIDKLQSLSSKNYDDLKDELGIGNLNFNLTVEDVLNLGNAIPTERAVIAINYPLIVLGRLANMTDSSFNVAVWMGS